MHPKPLKIIAAAATVGIAATVLAFQNCSSRKGDGGTVNASSCLASSVMRVVFPQGHTFSIPQGITNTPYQCVNQSGYSTVVFNASNQTLTLQGTSGSVTASLAAGGNPCGSQNRTGGDNWKSATGPIVDTVLTSSTLRITNTDATLSCEIAF